MALTYGEPLVNPLHRYAVAAPSNDGSLVPVQTYETVIELREGYVFWKGVSVPDMRETLCPVEMSSDECKVLTDILDEQ